MSLPHSFLTGKGGGDDSLYPFTSHTFTTCSAFGRFGPSQGQINLAYAGTEVEGFVTGSQIQLWTVPIEGEYSFFIKGARAEYGGDGVQFSGRLILPTAGEVLSIIIGQMGSSTGQKSGGGGGGTFLWRSTDTAYPILAAGGGGGHGGSSHTQQNATMQNNGTGYNGGNTSVESQSNGYGGWYGAAGVSGRISSSGAGWNENGRQSQSDCNGALSCAGRFGYSPLNGGEGGQSHTTSVACSGASGWQSDGGFGGGSGAGYAAGAGGGGYSGGGGSSGCSNGGGSGGSYWQSPEVIESTSQGQHSGHGELELTYLG